MAIACSVIGGVIKLGGGFATGSMSLTASAIDSLGDLFVSLANLFLVRYAALPPDDDHNYGHAKVEGLGAMFEGGFIFAAAIFIAYEAIHKAVIGERSHDSLIGISVMVPVLALTAVTVLYLRRAARTTGSLVVKADSVHYLTDLWVNGGVLLALVLVKVTGMAIIDTVISVTIAVYMLWSSTHVVREGFDVVMDTSLEPSVVADVSAVLERCDRIHSFHDFKTRRGKVPYVDFHVVVSPEMTTQSVHDLFLQLQRDIRALVGPNTKVLMHADPADEAHVGAGAAEAHGELHGG